MSKIDYDLKQIKGVVFDVDGVLSPSTMPLMSDGTPSRMVNVKDSYALQLAIKMGYKIAIITGSDCMAVKKQFNGLGCIHENLNQNNLFEKLGGSKGING